MNSLFKTSSKSIFYLFILFISYSYGQKDYTLTYDADSIIKKGIRLHDDKKYEEAILQYNRISKLDPKYYTAMYEKIMSTLALEKKDEAKNLYKELIESKSIQNEPMLFTTYGSLLSDEKEYDESEKIFKQGEKYLSNNSNFLFNFAILYYRKKEIQKCIDYLEKTILINPNYSSAHYFLGVIALDEGRITEGTLALTGYLIANPTGKYAKDAIFRLDKKFGENFLEKGKSSFSKSGDNFEEIETILRNQLPLKKAYKVKSDFDDVIIRQIQAVAEYAVTHKMENGFFETTYMPWLKDIVEKNQFENFSYSILIGLEEELGKKITSKKKKITDFFDNYIGVEFWNIYAKRKMEHFGKEEDVVIFMQNSLPYYLGPIVDKKKHGKFKVLNEVGNVTGILEFKDDELDGEQKYFNDKGILIETKFYKLGKLDGVKTTYFSNGSLETVENYKEGVLEGLSTSYHINGGKDCEINFSKGERNGTLNCYYIDGTKKNEIYFKDGKLDGDYIQYDENGQIKNKGKYKNNEAEGAVDSFYGPNLIKSHVDYVNGKRNGNYKRYFSNAAIEEIEEYKDGILTSNKDYYANGKLSSETKVDSKGNTESITYYNSSEEKYYEERYKSNEFKYALQYDKNNPKPIEISLSKKPFFVKSNTGKVLISGAYEKGKKTGEWNYFYSNEILKSKENFTNGNQNGIAYYYERSGLIDHITNYKKDTINGLYERYNNGKLSKELYYTKDVAKGPYKTYYNDGKIETEGFYENDEVHGTELIYWQNGKLQSKNEYNNGVHLSAEFYNEKGEKETTLNFKDKNGIVAFKKFNNSLNVSFEMKNGTLNGKYTITDKINTPVFEGEFKNGLKHNLTKNYNPYGTIEFQANYYCGKINGLAKYYDLIGNLRLEEEYIYGKGYGRKTRYYPFNQSKFFEYNEIDDLTEGEYKFFNSKGETILILGYDNNVLKHYIKKNKTGELKDKIDIQNETVSITSNYPNEKVAIKINFVKGNKEGEFIINNPDGKPTCIATYKNDLLNGTRIYYYENGNVYCKNDFIDGDYEGVQEYFTNDNKIIIRANYKNDELHGDFLIYKNGILNITKHFDSDELVQIKN